MLLSIIGRIGPTPRYAVKRYAYALVAFQFLLLALVCLICDWRSLVEHSDPFCAR